MVEAHKATGRNVQRTKPVRASPRASKSRSTENSAPASRPESKPAGARSAASATSPDGPKKKGPSSQKAHAFGAATLSAGSIAPLFSPVGPAVSHFLSGAAHRISQAAGALASAVNSAQSASSATMEEVESGGGVSNSPAPVIDWDKRVKAKPLYAGNGARVYQYRPGVGLDAEVRKFVETIDGLEDPERKHWLRQELNVSDDASARKVMAELQAHPNALVHVTDALGVDGLLLARPGKSNSNVFYWDLHYGDALSEEPDAQSDGDAPGEKPDAQSAILSRMVSQYIQLKGREDGYRFRPGDFASVKRFLQSIELGDVTSTAANRGYYAISPRNMTHIYFGPDGRVGNRRPEKTALYKISVQSILDLSKITDLSGSGQIGKLFQSGEIDLDSKLLIQGPTGSSQVGQLKDILDGIYTTNLERSSGSLYRWQRNKRVHAHGSYTDWSRKLVLEPSNASQLLQAVYQRSQNLNWYQFKNAVEDVKPILKQYRFSSSAWDNLQATDFFQNIYRPLSEGIPLLPEKLVKFHPLDTPEISRLLLQTKYLEAWNQYRATRPAATPEEFEGWLVQPAEASP